MPEPVERRIRDRELHEMEPRGSSWACTARNPRCTFTAGSLDEALAHVAGNQADRREEPPIVGPSETAA